MPKHSKRIVDVASLPWAEGPAAGSRYGSRTRRLGTAAGSARLGCSLYEVDPGKRAFPFHWHAKTEEAIYVLAGQGTLRIGDEEHIVSAGHYIALPAGLDCAHQLINTGSETLRYLCMSSWDGEFDVAGYPDSGKVGVWLQQDGTLVFRKLYRTSGETGDYFEGETTD